MVGPYIRVTYYVAGTVLEVGRKMRNRFHYVNVRDVMQRRGMFKSPVVVIVSCLDAFWR